MKKNRSLEKATDPGRPMEEITLSAHRDNKTPVESDLSPERIMDGASATTALLNQILAQRAELNQLRNWRINE
jgi:hypothetical protein